MSLNVKIRTRTKSVNEIMNDLIISVWILQHNAMMVYVMLREAGSVRIALCNLSDGLGCILEAGDGFLVVARLFQ
jgi:hypothetical protein